MKHLQRLLFWCCWPVLYIYFRSSERSRILIRANGKTLLVKGWWSKWFGDERWALPGGGLRHQEDAANGAARELSEELGIMVAVHDLSQIGSANVSEYGISYRAIFFALAISPADELQPKGHEVTVARWFTDQDISSLPLKPEVVKALSLSKTH